MLNDTCNLISINYLWIYIYNLWNLYISKFEHILSYLFICNMSELLKKCIKIIKLVSLCFMNFRFSQRLCFVIFFDFIVLLFLFHLYIYCYKVLFTSQFKHAVSSLTYISSKNPFK